MTCYVRPYIYGAMSLVMFGTALFSGNENTFHDSFFTQM